MPGIRKKVIKKLDFFIEITNFIFFLIWPYILHFWYYTKITQNHLFWDTSQKYFFKNIYFNYSLTLISCKITKFFWHLFQKNTFLNIFLKTKFRNVRFSQDTLFVMLLQEESKKLKKKSFWNFFGKSIFIRFS
jgi:hypothetical protein